MDSMKASRQESFICFRVSFVKLVLHKNHQNRKNQYNQVIKILNRNLQLRGMDGIWLVRVVWSIQCLTIYRLVFLLEGRSLWSEPYWAADKHDKHLWGRLVSDEWWLVNGEWWLVTGEWKTGQYLWLLDLWRYCSQKVGRWRCALALWWPLLSDVHRHWGGTLYQLFFTWNIIYTIFQIN